MKKLLTMIGAAAIALATALPSLAADWTDASGNEYTALKYVKGNATNGGRSDGPWMVLTNITAQCTDTVKMKFKLVNTFTQGLWCSRTNATSHFSAFYSVSSNKKISFYRKNGTAVAHSKELNADDECTVIADYNARKFTVNGETETLSVGTDSYDVGPIMLFGTYSTGTDATYSTAASASNRGSYYLYYFQIYSSTGTLRHNLLPATNMTAQTVGLFDTVTRTFYTPDYSSYPNYKFSTAEWGSDRAGKKWLGAGDGVSMSDDDNWEGGAAPVAGDDLDFTIAVPFSDIDADINATFGKVYLGTGDLPAFTGSLSATAINDLTRMQAYDAATAGFTFTLEASTGQDFTWNGAAAANWWTTDLWTYNSAASSWYDNNNAIFNTANATATLDADATAASVAFNAPAIIGGAATLTVPTVSVASGVSATISAPTVGALEKTGAGTLALTQSRTAATTLTEGTLKMLNGATVSGLTLGTSDPTKPVVFDYGGQTLTAAPETYLVTGSAVTLTNGTFAANGMLAIRDSKKLPSVLTIAKGAELYKYGADQLVFDAQGEATVNVVGGTVRQTGNHRLYIQSASTNGTLRINVTDGGLLDFPDAVLAMCCPGNFAYYNPSLYMVFNDSTFRVRSGYGDLDIFLGCPDSGTHETYRPINPTGVIAATNSVFDVGRGIFIGRSTTSAETAGSYTADFENCVITAKTFAVNHDRPLNNARLNGTRFVFGAASGSIAASDGADNWITVGDSGLTFDTQAFSCTLGANLGGSGAVTKVGTGTLTVASNQTASAAFNVNEGTLAVNGGVSISRPMAVASGATLKVNATDTASISSLTPAAGSTLDIASYNGHTPLALTSLTLPADGTVNLTLNGGAFPQGVYAVCSAPGVTESDGAKFAPSTGTLGTTWRVENNALILTVGEVSGNYWTGRGGDSKMSTAANWLNGVPAEGAAIDFSVVSSATTIIADTGRTFGAVTMGDGVITFSGEFAATSFSDTAKIAVGENATVTVAGDYVFSASVDEYICNTVAAGGRFVVTGDIVMDTGKGKYLRPCAGSIAGTITARGLVNKQSATVNYGRSFALAPSSTHVNWEIGDDGISGSRMLFVSADPDSFAKITASADFTVSATVPNYQRLELDSAGHVITLGDGTTGGLMGNGTNTISGTGRVVANYDIDDLTSTASSKIQPFVIKSAATFAIMPGADIGSGAVTVESGATLGVAQSGTVTLGGDLTLDDGATLAFNFTESATSPVLAVAAGKTFAANGAVTVKVSGVRPKGGEKILTTCGGFNTDGVNVSLAEDVPNWVNGLSVNGDGDIVLDVKPFGMIIFFK